MSHMKIFMITLNFIPKKFEAFLLIYKDGKTTL